MCDLKTTIMRRNSLSASEAEKLILYAKQRVADGDDPEDVLQEEFGLECDYSLDLY